MSGLFVFLYPLVGILSILAYVPQIKSLLKTRTSPDDISLSSWLMWIFSCLLSLGYGIFHLKDVLFCLTTALGLFFMVLIVSTVLYKRYRYGYLRGGRMFLFFASFLGKKLQPIPLKKED